MKQPFMNFKDLVTDAAVQFSSVICVGRVLFLVS